jgi:hypothetical protein
MGRKLSTRYIHIWGCSAHVLEGKTDKLEFETEGYLFYSHKDNKVFVTTNARFLEK